MTDTPPCEERRKRSLPDPYPEYLACPYCGEPEIEVWCYQEGAACHNCAQWIPHARPACFGQPGCCRANAA